MVVRRGLLAVYKPLGVTSAEVIAALKHTLLSQQGLMTQQQDTSRRRRRRRTDSSLKVGHGGTLDKHAEGVLVVGIGDYCKKLGLFQNNCIKSYEVMGRLGVTTDSLDCDGVVVERKDYTHVTHDKLASALHSFHGVITQVPPLYSALKHKGRRLSDYAREAKATGTTLDLPPKLREVNISSITLLNFNPPSFSLAVTCSSGTYMRSLVRDIAKALNTVGYMTHLTRTSVGPFTLQHALKQDQDRLWTLDSIRSAVSDSAAFVV